MRALQQLEVVVGEFQVTTPWVGSTHARDNGECKGGMPTGTAKGKREGEHLIACSSCFLRLRQTHR